MAGEGANFLGGGFTSRPSRIASSEGEDNSVHVPGRYGAAHIPAEVRVSEPCIKQMLCLRLSVGRGCRVRDSKLFSKRRGNKAEGRGGEHHFDHFLTVCTQSAKRREHCPFPIGPEAEEKEAKNIWEVGSAREGGKWRLRRRVSMRVSARLRINGSFSAAERKSRVRWSGTAK